MDKTLGYYPEAFITTLGAAIVRIQSISALNRFVAPIDFDYRERRCLAYTHVGETLFPQMCKVGWDEGAQFLLRKTIKVLDIAYDEFSNMVGHPIGLMDQLARMLDCYFTANTEQDLPILEALVQLNRSYLSSEQFTLNISPALHSALENLGNKIVQQENITLRDFCLTVPEWLLDTDKLLTLPHWSNTDFIFPIHGMLKTTLLLQKRDWALEIISELLKTHATYWIPDQNHIPAPVGKSNCLRETY